MALLSNIPAMSNSMLNRPLQGALNRVASQNMGFYASQPTLTNMAQEERLKQEQDGLINTQPNRKKKLKAKALQSPMVDMASAVNGTAANTAKIMPTGPIYG